MNGSNEGMKIDIINNSSKNTDKINSFRKYSDQ